MALSSTSLIEKYGKPIMVKYVETGTHNAGDVIVVGTTPFVAHTDVPSYTGGTLADALSSRGGVYTGASDGTPVIGQDVYWNSTSKKFTATSVGNAHFGVCVAGPTGDLAGASPTIDGDLVDVLHAPLSSPGGVDTAVRSEATASATATLTAAQLLGGMINSAPVAGITLTLPTAALMVAGVKGAAVGDSFDVTIENTSAGANAITLAGGAGATFRGGTSVAQNKAALLRVLITNVTAASEAYTVHSIIGA